MGWPGTGSASACPGSVTGAGRRRDYCSKKCKQASYRTRAAATRAADQARNLRRELTTAASDLMKAFGALFEEHTRMTQAEIDASGDPDKLLMTGWRWESTLRGTGRAVQQAATELAKVARLHERAVIRYQSARIDLNHLPPADRQALLKAISTIARLTTPGKIQQLPDDPAAALRDPAAALAAAIARDHQTHLSGELLAAATAVLAAGRPHSRQLPAPISTALAQFAKLLPPGELLRQMCNPVR